MTSSKCRVKYVWKSMILYVHKWTEIKFSSVLIRFYFSECFEKYSANYKLLQDSLKIPERKLYKTGVNVQILWEGHKILKNIPVYFESNIKTKWEIFFQIFLAFSEYLNFRKQTVVYQIESWCFTLQKSCYID